MATKIENTNVTPEQLNLFGGIVRQESPAQRRARQTIEVLQEIAKEDLSREYGMLHGLLYMDNYWRTEDGEHDTEGWRLKRELIDTMVIATRLDEIKMIWVEEAKASLAEFEAEKK